MPVLGWLAGRGLQDVISGIDHWVAFGLLCGIGCRMIYEAVKLEPAERKLNILAIRSLLVLSVATSIDALAVGVTFSLLEVSIIAPVVVIGSVTFALSLLGVLIGDRFGHLFESRIEVLGGVILIGIGLKVLAEHLL
jgi:putative Mn2+ efflux pump MntP